MKANNHKQKGRLPVEMDWVLLSAEGMILPVPSEKKRKHKGAKIKGTKTGCERLKISSFITNHKTKTT